MALLGIATIICDIIVLYCMQDREIYRDKKYLMVRGSDAFSVYRDDDTEELIFEASSQRRDDDQTDRNDER